jgi:adenylylsulfate kinase-like enzyme
MPHSVPFIVTREMREDLLGQRSHVFWLTGLSGSGKSTLSKLLEKRLYDEGFKTILLDFLQRIEQRTSAGWLKSIN